MKILFLGYNNTQTSLINFLEDKNYNVEHYSDKIDLNYCQDFDFIISFGYQHIINKKIINHWKNKIINLHMSYLPYNRGSSPNYWAINDKTPSGVTIHLIDEGIDTGDILIQKEVKFNSKKDTYRTTYNELKLVMENLFKENYKEILTGKIIPQKQQHKGTIHFDKDLPHNINWDKPINKKVISAHQPSYLPWMGFFNKIINSDVFIVMDSVQYEKNSFINRNKINTPNGNIWLTIPVFTKDYKTKQLKDLEIQNNKWKKKHWDSIFFNYKNSPYFNDYSGLVKNIYYTDYVTLGDLLKQQLNVLIKMLEIDTQILYLSDLDINSSKQELVKDMCLSTSSNEFLFGAQGKNYAEKEYFDKNNINIKFQEVKPNTNNLSILDILFNKGIDNLKKQINESFSFSRPS
tara:strand:- start:713 stop:1927 length:1215 start_codon:yes stop_codon:yes gene_type:complete